jgi:hypothetical protein
MRTYLHWMPTTRLTIFASWKGGASAAVRPRHIPFIARPYDMNTRYEEQLSDVGMGSNPQTIIEFHCISELVRRPDFCFQGHWLKDTQTSPRPGIKGWTIPPPTQGISYYFQHQCTRFSPQKLRSTSNIVFSLPIMKVYIVFLPVLTSIGMAATIDQDYSNNAHVVRDIAAKEAEALDLIQQMTEATAICCPATPCFIGCPTGGQWAVSCPV